jgi:hypothetical protein
MTTKTYKYYPYDELGSLITLRSSVYQCSMTLGPSRGPPPDKILDEITNYLYLCRLLNRIVRGQDPGYSGEEGTPDSM